MNESNPSLHHADTLAGDAMRNEGGHAGRSSLYPWWSRERGRRLTVSMLAILQSRTGGRELHRNETHLNRGRGRIWFYWPAIAAAAGLAVGGVILAMSDSVIGANISLMLRKLI
jgi:hypothetical protein